MKTFFILLFALFVTPLGWSAPFGFLPGAENIDNPSAPSALLRKIVSGEPVCVSVQSFRSNETRTEEEYLEMLRRYCGKTPLRFQARRYDFEVFYLSEGEDAREAARLESRKNSCCQHSGDNRGGQVWTIWKECGA